MQENIIDIGALDMDARGIGHLANEDGTPGKVIFVEGALPGEQVSYRSIKVKKRWEAAVMTGLHRQSSQRITPKCEYFGLCGGCAMQHLEPSAQVAIKQRVLEDDLWHIGKVRPQTIMRPIHGPTWGYRYRARLSVHFVIKKDGVLVGFNEKKTRYITDMSSCEVLPPHVSAMLLPMRELFGFLTIRDQVPQVELAIGEGEQGRVTALVIRIISPLKADDESKLKAFADTHQIQWWLQPTGPETAQPYYPPGNSLHYTLPEFGIRMPFKPTDFTQVNHYINRLLVAKAMQLLDIRQHERIADLFCGLGNFTLPIATLAREVIGLEGSTTLTERARENAIENGLSGKTVFGCRNLFEITPEDFIELGKFDRMLIDPPRDGAMAVCNAIVALGQTHPDLQPRRIVYVSCSPSTLARDAAILVHEGHYVLNKAGVVNMFPHTSHVESIAVFDLVD